VVVTSTKWCGFLHRLYCSHIISFELTINAIGAGLLLGSFYAAVTIGVTISFGMLDIVNIAHSTFIMLGSFIMYLVTSNFALDSIATGIVVVPPFYLVASACVLLKRARQVTLYYTLLQGGCAPPFLEVAGD